MHPGDTDRAGADPESEGTSERADGHPTRADDRAAPSGRAEGRHQVNERTDGGVVDTSDGVDDAGHPDARQHEDGRTDAGNAEDGRTDARRGDAGAGGEEDGTGNLLEDLAVTDDPDDGDSVERDGDGGRDADALPYIFARQTVKADRDALPVYVRPETDAAVETLERRLSERFDRDDLMALDVREALLTVGLRNADDVVETLESWGYGRR
ncbi:hypothetical protein ACFO0N_01455 [Halobium salinum]|uniref:Uncharacterized protein n=1 Tax=Halobium salinum TaxID=1364940 RepID=A0ABD5P6Z2_9EURY|nr:hypothetical protein [Halobium salinum]